MRRHKDSTLALLLAASVAAVFVVAIGVGCGGKKPKEKTADDVDAGPVDIGDDEEEVFDPGAIADPVPETDPGVEAGGPAVYPEAPANIHPGRQTRPYLLSVRKAQVMPTKATGECWDTCDSRTASALSGAMTAINALPAASAGGFDLAAKTLQAAIGLVGGQEALPDIYVHIRCGHGQAHATRKTGAMNRIIATWTGENKTLHLDERDQCVVSLWDHDDDGDEEIGRATVQLVQLANAGGGTARIFGREVGFGQVYYLELGLTPGDAAAAPSPGTTPVPAPGTTPAPAPGASAYSVTVVRAEVKPTKADGSPWDVALPLVGKSEPDPFVNAWVNGYKSPQPFMTTAVKDDTFTPVWEESGVGHLGPNDHIVFMVWDKDAVTDDLIGECKTGPMKSQALGEVVFRECGQVISLVVRISKN